MDIKRHPATHLATICLLKVPHSFWAKNHCNKSVSCYSLRPCEFFGKLPAFHDLFNLWTNTDIGFNFCCRQLRERNFGDT